MNFNTDIVLLHRFEMHFHVIVQFYRQLPTSQGYFFMYDPQYSWSLIICLVRKQAGFMERTPVGSREGTLGHSTGSTRTHWVTLSKVLKHAGHSLYGA